jgi:hypothetical protein
MTLSSVLIFALLWASTAWTANPFHKPSALTGVGPVVEKLGPRETFRHPELQKRASRFLNDKTKGTEIRPICGILLTAYRICRQWHCHPQSEL